MGQKNTKGIPQENPNAPLNHTHNDMIYNIDGNGQRVCFEDFTVLRLVGKGLLFQNICIIWMEQ